MFIVERWRRTSVAKAVFFGWLLGCGVVGFPPSLEAAHKDWIGWGDGVHWSDTNNWSPPRPLQNGDSLFFGGNLQATPDSMVNDLTGLSIKRMELSSESDQFSTQWFLEGNDLIIAEEIYC